MPRRCRVAGGPVAQGVTAPVARAAGVRLRALSGRCGIDSDGELRLVGEDRGAAGACAAAAPRPRAHRRCSAPPVAFRRAPGGGRRRRQLAGRVGTPTGRSALDRMARRRRKPSRSDAARGQFRTIRRLASVPAVGAPSVGAGRCFSVTAASPADGLSGSAAVPYCEDARRFPCSRG